MSSPISSIGKFSIQFSEEAVCPITFMPFTRPWILLEDGFTYEKSAIEQWLKSKPNRSPLIGDIRTATLRPNCTVKNENPICPITHEPFQVPYYCVEDGQTYEKDAIIEWFNVKIREGLENELSSMVVKSPVTGVPLDSLTLYPNKILFDKGIPQEQNPVVFKFDIKKIISDYMEMDNQEVKCVFDAEIRNLIDRFVKEKNYEKKNELKGQIAERRESLGLNVKKTFYKTLDLSHLNLSKMNLIGLGQKGSILKETDLSDSILQNCDLSQCRFLNCNMQRAFFINCNFSGEEVSFFRTDMQDAIIDANCLLEKGSTWKRITNWGDFITELSRRGAMNVDSMTFRVL